MLGLLLVPAQPLAADGTGRMTISPVRVAAGSTNTFTLTFAADTGPLKGQTLVDVPRGWTAPQATNPNGAGYIRVAPGTCAASTKLLGVAFRRLVIATSCARGQTFTITYANATAAVLSADGYVFLAQTRPDPSTLPKPKPKPAPKGKKAKKRKRAKRVLVPFRPLASKKQAYVVVTGGPFHHLVVQTTSVAIAGTPFGVTVRAVDAYGNNSPSYTGAVSFSSSDAAAALPTSGYRFTSTDAGGHLFTGVTLRTVGAQTISASDDQGHSGTSTGIAVYPAGSG